MKWYCIGRYVVENPLNLDSALLRTCDFSFIEKLFSEF